ncbi:MAG: CHAT domain-containing protein, partial [Nitrososphaeraceae archaeon]|nr:CHAT domain-containing protein [Nitrososphaeraceae archaeon]
TKNNLPLARYETQKIQSLMEENTKVDLVVLEGEKATYGNVRRYLQEEYFDIVHVASHAGFEQDKPEESGVILNDAALGPDGSSWSRKSELKFTMATSGFFRLTKSSKWFFTNSFISSGLRPGSPLGGMASGWIFFLSLSSCVFDILCCGISVSAIKRQI